jgi:hypothetical protein
MKDGNAGVQKRFRGFLAEHPGGWGHEDWVTLLEELSDAGVDISREDEIGLTLERERVKAFLEGTGVKGLGPKRRDALASRFGRLWDLEHATVDELAEIPTVPRSLAEAVHRALN